MNDEQLSQLVDYVRQHLNQGVPEENIRNLLLQHNWPVEAVQHAFTLAQTPSAPHALQQPPNDPQPSQAGPGQNGSTQAASRKYKVFFAIGETFRAISKNAGLFILSLIGSYLLAGVTLVLVSLIIGKVFVGDAGLAGISPNRFMVALIASLVLYTLWYSFIGAFVLSITSLLIYEGAEGRKASLPKVIRQSVSRMGRLVLVDILFVFVAIWPIVVILFIPIIALFTGELYQLAMLTPLLLLGAIAWMFIVLFRFALASQVALFEPEVSVFKTLARSRHLLEKGGQWFIVKTFLLLLLLVVVLAVATGQTLEQIESSNDTITSLVLIVATILLNGVMALLYRNRRAVKG